MFTDLEGHTAMLDRRDDHAGRNVLRAYELVTRQALDAHGGVEVKTLGDGFLASFTSAGRALRCALSLVTVTENEDGQERLRVRVGMNAGEPIAEADDIFGTSVVVASRIASFAAGGQVLVSDVVQQLARGKDFNFSDRGEQILKGLPEPVRIWQLHPEF